MASVKYGFGGKTVVVTGGMSGIGRQMALQFGAAGATVLVADIQETPKDTSADPTHETIEAEGGTAEFVQTDVTDPKQIQSLVEAAGMYGGIDVMVNNAGIIERNSLLETTPESAERTHSVNVSGVLFGCKYAAQDMIERDNSGVILNTASINSTMSDYGHVMYDASKGAVMMITRSAALELADHDIRVNAIAPGYIPTQLSEDGPEAVKKEIEEGNIPKRIPMDRGGDPAEVASGALFLCTDAASYTTGEMLHLDGGYHVL